MIGKTNTGRIYTKKQRYRFSIPDNSLIIRFECYFIQMNLKLVIILQRLLDEATRYREDVVEELKKDVNELEQLNELLLILDQIFDLDLKIDSIYQPIEVMYNDLESFELPILRSEENELQNLRQYWSSLIKMAENQRNRLLNERRNVFHQELDKQMKVHPYII